MNRKPYANGFNIIIESIIDTSSARPKKDKSFITKMDRVFRGITNINTLDFVFNSFYSIVLQEENLIIRNLKIDCLKRQNRHKIMELSI